MSSWFLAMFSRAVAPVAIACCGMELGRSGPAIGDYLVETQTIFRAFFSALTDTGYAGAVCVEVEDRAYERSLADRQRSLRQSRKFLEQFLG